MSKSNSTQSTQSPPLRDPRAHRSGQSADTDPVGPDESSLAHGRPDGGSPRHGVRVPPATPSAPAPQNPHFPRDLLVPPPPTPPEVLPPLKSRSPIWLAVHRAAPIAGCDVEDWLNRLLAYLKQLKLTGGCTTNEVFLVPFGSDFSPSVIGQLVGWLVAQPQVVRVEFLSGAALRDRLRRTLPREL